MSSSATNTTMSYLINRKFRHEHMTMSLQLRVNVSVNMDTVHLVEQALERVLAPNGVLNSIVQFAMTEETQDNAFPNLEYFLEQSEDNDAYKTPIVTVFLVAKPWGESPFVATSTLQKQVTEMATGDTEFIEYEQRADLMLHKITEFTDVITACELISLLVLSKRANDLEKRSRVVFASASDEGDEGDE